MIEIRLLKQFCLLIETIKELSLNIDWFTVKRIATF